MSPRPLGEDPVLFALGDVAMAVAQIEWVSGTLVELRQAAERDDQVTVDRLTRVAQAALSDARGILGRGR